MRRLSSWPKIALAMILIETVVPGWLLYAKAQDVMKVQAPSYNAPSNRGYNFQGGQSFGSCNTFAPNSPACNNYGPQKLKFDTQLGDELVGFLAKCKRVVIMGVGSNSDVAISSQYVTYLKGKVVNITDFSSAGVISPPPEKKISIGLSEDQCGVTISPSLN